MRLRPGDVQELPAPAFRHATQPPGTSVITRPAIPSALKGFPCASMGQLQKLPAKTDEGCIKITESIKIKIALANRDMHIVEIAL